jgi:hypothetical protein
VLLAKLDAASQTTSTAYSQMTVLSLAYVRRTLKIVNALQA